jgi:protein TonB
MFRDTLLESAPIARKRKRWPMALAFTLELLAGAVLIVLPLLSTGIIPVSARVPLIAPRLVRVKAIDDSQPKGDRPSEGGGPSTTRTVIELSAVRGRITPGPSTPEPPGPDAPTLNPVGGSRIGLPICDPCITPETPKPPTRVRISMMQPGMLINRVEPQYPKLAIATGIQGSVRLHAIIAKDGTIQSLTVISGHPFLAHAAVDAVKQWRYQPYILNGEVVEVDTFITVNFNRGT